MWGLSVYLVAFSLFIKFKYILNTVQHCYASRPSPKRTINTAEEELDVFKIFYTDIVVNLLHH